MSTLRFQCIALAMIMSFGTIGMGLGRFNSVSYAGDWPQILGPNRDGQSDGTRAIKADWQQNRPQELWRLSCGSGYAGAAIAQAHVFAFDRQGDEERLSMLALSSGQTVWQVSWKSAYRSGVNPDVGPRAVPCVADNQVVCYGAGGDLVCVDVASGKIRWQRPIRKELKADDGYFGAGSSPLIIGDNIIVNVGGKQAGIVAVSLTSGKDVWKATNFDASYSSPIAIDIDGKPAVLVVTRLQTVLLQADTGKVLGQVDFGARGPTVNAATPIPIGGGRYFLTASYGIGTKTLAVESGRLVERSTDRQLLASQYNTPVWIEKVIVGANGREDMGGVSLRTIDSATLKTIDDKNLPGPTHFIARDKQILMLSIDGTLQLARVEEGLVKLLDKLNLDKSGHVFRALPAYADGVFLARSSNQDGSGGEWIAVKLPEE